jgi:hypothetical protein
MSSVPNWNGMPGGSLIPCPPRRIKLNTVAEFLQQVISNMVSLEQRDPVYDTLNPIVA